MKTAVTVLIVAVLLISWGSKIGLVGFHYPQVIRDEPLRHPQKVTSVQDTNLFLESGAVIGIDKLYASDISNKLRQSAFEIDINEIDGKVVAIYARQDGWVCGTPWAQPIRIPLIPDKTYRNRRELVAIGVLESNGQDGAANGSEPVSTETTRAPSMDGSRRGP